MRAPVLVLFALLVAAGCGAQSRAYVGPDRVTGTCPGACEHYVRCKSDDSQALYQACVAECRNIFTEDGVRDRGSLRGLERLTCVEMVSFVEGEVGREPGEQTTETATATTKVAP